MTRPRSVLNWHDHAAALLATLATAHGISLIDLAGWWPAGLLMHTGLSGYLVGAGLCGLAYVIVLGTLYRRRMVKGPLYRCAETRPPEDFGTVYAPGEKRLLDSWHYR